jgi:AraC-like DNA-binding protein
MTLDIPELISVFTVFQLVILTVVILNYKKGKRLSNLLLAGFMASNAILIAQFLLKRFGWISHEKWTLVYSIGNYIYLLLIPFLYLYIRSLCYKDFRLRASHLIHGLPFAFLAVFSIFNYFLNNFIRQTGTVVYIQQQMGSVEYWSRNIILHIQVISYLIASAVVLVKYRNQLRDLYSSIEKIDLNWCNLLLIAFASMWFMDFLSWTLYIFHASFQFISYWLLVSSLLINLTFTLIVTYKGLTQTLSFSGIQAPPKYAASRMKQSDCDEIIRKLSEYVKNEKPYLIPSLSLEDLSEKLTIPVKSLSQAINTRLKQNFYDFINSHRVEEIKKRLFDERFRNLTLLALAYDSGFNSKSVFNAAFKKHTGMTPKEYKFKHSFNREKQIYEKTPSV